MKRSPLDGLDARESSHTDAADPGRTSPGDSTSGDGGEASRLLHELQVHQVELEAQQEELRSQNEQLRLAREATRVALRRYTELYDFAPVAYFTLTRQGAITQTNFAGAELLGAPRSELSGRLFSLYVQHTDRDSFVVLLEEMFHTGLRQGLEVALVGDSARSADHLVRIEGQRDTLDEMHCRVVVMDLSEHRSAQRQLREAASVWDAMNEAVMVSDAGNRIVAVNPAFMKVTGYPAKEVIGKSVAILNVDREEDVDHAACRDGPEGDDERDGGVWHRRRDGSAYLAEMSIHTLLSEEGGVSRRISVFRDITEQRRLGQIMWHQANYDALTELPNRQLFMDRLRQSVDRAVRTGRQMALLYVDLDRFKEINDSQGHQVGDLILVEAARRIASCVRATDTTARIGGDEFTVVMIDVDHLRRTTEVAQRIVEVISQPFRCAERDLYTAASIGITVCPGDSTDPNELLKHADQAMYTAKTDSGGGFRFYTARMQAVTMERIRLIEGLHDAMAGKQFELHYQPIVRLGDRSIGKVEALLRWNHPELGLIRPDRFIPLAEEIGLIDELGDWVFREATRQVASWRAGWSEGAVPWPSVSINTSPHQFLRPRQAQDWVDLLRELELPPSAVIIEITETVLLDDRPEVLDALRCFRSNGIAISLDDFGQGYSALSYLTRFPIDHLKIDRAFIEEMTAKRSSLAVVEAIIAMSHKLGINVIAEGVESQRQCTLLMEAGCDDAQGNFLGGPVPARDLHLG